jgi:pyruvate/2-oxoglutarate dehydrogenase complex dihydrolipoamide dehydrogenase (E3) component
MADVVILGGGPAGVTAALRARELGATVTLVERSRMGGTCTLDGCVPTRVLAKSARLLRDAGQFADYGLLLDKPPTVDFAGVISRTQQVVYQMQEKKQLLDHLRDVHVQTLTEVGNARFLDPHTIQPERGEAVHGDHFILCVGGSARRLPLPGVEHTLTHSDVWTLRELPASVAIVGSGATGCQLASIFEAFGSKVTLIDIAPRILIAEDTLVSETVAREFSQRNIDVITGIEKIDRIELDGKLRHLIYRNHSAEAALAVEAVILAVGWPGNVDQLNLPAAGVEVERGYIKVNDYLQTTAPHIFAAGDITGRMMLVQSASYQARVAVENALLGLQRLAEHRLVPHGGFTDPEYGSVGFTEEQARQYHPDCVVAVVPYADMDRAVIDGHPVGFCKLIVDRHTHNVIGAHVVGEQAVEIVQMVSMGMAGNLKIELLADLELAYPTFAAVVGLAARQLVRDLDAVQVAPEWRALKQIRGAEWERKDI